MLFHGAGCMLYMIRCFPLFPRPMQPRAAVAPLAVLALALPFLFAYTSPPSANFWPWLASWACAGVLAALLLAGLDWPRRTWARHWSVALVLAALVAAGIGLAQYFLGDPGAAPWVQPSTPGQAIGNLRQRNQQATLLSLGLWALLWAVAQWQAGGQAGRQARWVGVAVGLLLSWGLVLLAAASAATASRTGALQWLLVLGLVLCWRRMLGPLPLALAVVGLLAYGAASWALPHLLEQWTGIPADRLFARFADDGQGCGGRKVLWTNVLYLIAQRPWTGWGWGELDYAHYVTEFPGTRFCVLLDNAHNLPLHLAVELGVPVAALVVLALLAWVLRAQPWREPDPARQLAWGVLALIGLHSLLEYPLWYGPFQVSALAAVLLLWRKAPHLRPAARGAGALVLCALVAAGAYAGWDYWRVGQIYRPVAQRAPAYREITLDKVADTRLFARQVEFARLTTTPVTRDNAPAQYAMALRLLHFSPEPRVIAPLIDSARLLGLDAQAAFHEERFRQAYPDDYARWARRRGIKPD